MRGAPGVRDTEAGGGVEDVLPALLWRDDPIGRGGKSKSARSTGEGVMTPCGSIIFNAPEEHSGAEEGEEEQREGGVGAEADVGEDESEEGEERIAPRAPLL